MAETSETAEPRGRASQPGEQPRASAVAPVDRLVEILDALPGGSVILTTMEQMLNWEACRPADLGAKADGPCTDAPILNMGASKG